MKVAFRADASDVIGTGHVMRCRTLARALKRRGVDVEFICRAHPGNRIAVLEQEGFRVRSLSPPLAPARPGTGDYDAWRGVPEEQDIAETLAAMSAATDWIVVDHYGLAERWEKCISASGAQVMAIDDLGRRHAALVVLDQNLSLDARRYANLPADRKILLGPSFALLGPEYAAAHGTEIKSDASRVLAFFGGGAARAGIMDKTVEALCDPSLSDLALDAVIGFSGRDKNDLRARAGRRPHTTLHGSVPTLMPLMAGADIAIGAGGITMLERCCLGLPSIVVSIAENQNPGSAALAAAGAIQFLGFADALESGSIRDAVRAMRSDMELRRRMSEQGRRLVDGLGTERVAETLIPTATAELDLRPAVAADCAFYYRLASDPAVRQASFNSDPIPWPQHQAWFAAKLAASETRMWVLMAGRLPVGQIRFDHRDHAAYIDYSLDVVARGRGWGRALLRHGLGAFFRNSSTTVRAEVKSTNTSSYAIFERLGFKSFSGDGVTRLYALTHEEFAASDHRDEMQGSRL